MQTFKELNIKIYYYIWLCLFETVWPVKMRVQQPCTLTHNSLAIVLADTGASTSVCPINEFRIQF